MTFRKIAFGLSLAMVPIAVGTMKNASGVRIDNNNDKNDYYYYYYYGSTEKN